MRPQVTRLAAAVLAFCLFVECRRADQAAAEQTLVGSASVQSVGGSPIPAYTGTDGRGIPRYARISLTAEERSLLRRVYGIEHPSHLYISDSTDAGLLKYDPQLKRCRTCYVDSYRLGFISVRGRGESWEQLERRIRATPLSSFRRETGTSTNSLGSLDPDIQPDVKRMLADARKLGFRLRVVVAYRSPQREAYLMAKGGGSTHTLTSLHSYGRAIDLAVGDGNLSHAATRKQWIAFRRWVTGYNHHEFRILGTPDKSWDWAHAEIPSPTIGFSSIDEALSRAKSCVRSAGCDFQPHLPR